jgi:hypothetical protein
MKSYHNLNSMLITSLLALVLHAGNWCQIGQAQPVVKLETRPPRIKTIAIGSDAAGRGILLMAETSAQTVQFAWSLNGPGELQEDRKNPAIFYFPPEALRGDAADVVITVEVTDENNVTVSVQKSLTLVAPVRVSTPTPLAKIIPTPTPLAAVETLQVEQHLEAGDKYFKRQWFTEGGPNGENAFAEYRAALDIEPDNKHALAQLEQMLDFYENNATRFYNNWLRNWNEQTARRKASQYYERYLKVAKFYVELCPEGSLQSKIEAVKQRFEQLESPRDSRWIKMEQLTQQLVQKQERYATLKQAERQGKAVKDRMIPLLEAMLEDIDTLEIIYRQLAEIRPDAISDEQFVRLRIASRTFESELAAYQE